MKRNSLAFAPTGEAMNEKELACIRANPVKRCTSRLRLTSRHECACAGADLPSARGLPRSPSVRRGHPGEPHVGPAAGL
eukprot:364569-Chlamydomonas_euryale.AAC.3